MPVELSRRERKKEETRGRIFKAAVALFTSKGFEETTIDEICERADVAKGTFFNYFPRKEAVLAYLSEKKLLEAEENAEAILAAARPARDKLMEIYTAAASAWEEDRELSRYVFVELMRRSFAPTEEAGRAWDDLIERVVRAGQASGQIRPGVDARRAVTVMGHVYITAVYGWLCCPEGSYDLQTELREQLDLVMDGLAA